MITAPTSITMLVDRLSQLACESCLTALSSPLCRHSNRSFTSFGPNGGPIFGKAPIELEFRDNITIFAGAAKRAMANNIECLRRTGSSIGRLSRQRRKFASSKGKISEPRHLLFQCTRNNIYSRLVLQEHLHVLIRLNSKAAQQQCLTIRIAGFEPERAFSREFVKDWLDMKHGLKVALRCVRGPFGLNRLRSRYNCLPDSYTSCNKSDHRGRSCRISLCPSFGHFQLSPHTIVMEARAA